jgi:hypothetical protein
MRTCAQHLDADFDRAFVVGRGLTRDAAIESALALQQDPAQGDQAVPRDYRLPQDPGIAELIHRTSRQHNPTTSG